MRRLAALVAAVLETEMDLHREFAARWGDRRRGARVRANGAGTGAYCDFLLRTAALGDFAELAAALLPCMWSYAEIGARLAAAGHERYADWIAMYASDEFAELAGWPAS